MTRRPPVVDELRDRTRRLEAERLRPERPLPPRRVAADLRLLIGILARLLTNPPPPDPARFEHGEKPYIVQADTPESAA